jgi:hypothetical protein
MAKFGKTKKGKGKKARKPKTSSGGKRSNAWRQYVSNAPLPP